MSSPGPSRSNTSTNHNISQLNLQSSGDQLNNTGAGSNRSLNGNNPTTPPQPQRLNSQAKPPSFSMPPGFKICVRCKRPCEPTSHIALRDGSVVHHACFVCDMCHKELPLKFALKHGKYYHAECYMIAKANAPRCQRCTEAILPGDVRVDTGHTGNFHGRCFVCDQCKGQLREGFVSMNNAFYHYECTVCSMCYTPLAGSNYSQLQEGGFLCDNCLYMHMQFQTSQMVQPEGVVPPGGVHVTASTLPSLNQFHKNQEQPPEEKPAVSSLQNTQQKSLVPQKQMVVQEKTYMKDEAWIPSTEASTNDNQSNPPIISEKQEQTKSVNNTSISKDQPSAPYGSNLSLQEENQQQQQQQQQQQPQINLYSSAEYQYYMQQWGNYAYQPAAAPLNSNTYPQQIPQAEQAVYSQHPSFGQYSAQNMYYGYGTNSNNPTDWIYNSGGSQQDEYNLVPGANSVAAASKSNTQTLSKISNQASLTDQNPLKEVDEK